MKKSLVFGMLLASSLLVACGSSNPTSSATGLSTADSRATSLSTEESKSTGLSSSASSEAVKTLYQIGASYEELYDMFGAFEFYGLMDSAGNGTLYKALIQSSGENMNKAVVDEEATVTFKYKAVDDDGIETLEASIGGQRYSGYKNKDGAFVLKDYKFPFAGGYSRQVDLLVSETVEYASKDAWVEAVNEKYKDRTKEVVVSAIYEGAVVYADGDNEGQPWSVTLQGYPLPGFARITFNSDFTCELKYGGNAGEMGIFGGDTFQGTWTIGEDKVHTITVGEETFKGTLEGEVETIVWNIVHYNKDETGAPVGDGVNLTASLALVEAE